MPNTSSDYQQLKQQLRELLDKAMANQLVLERFQRFELVMLSAESMAGLLEALLEKSLQHFNLADCRMIWLEHRQPLRAMLAAEIMQQAGKKLLFNDDVALLEGIFSTPGKPVLQALSLAQGQHWFGLGSAVESAAFIPLACDGVLVGCYILGSADAARFTTDKAVDFMAHMGLIAAMCLQNGINKECIRRLGMMDTLTQVKNRRCFDSDMRQEVARAQRAGQALSCLFLDADFFKTINDNHGHQAGDAVLCALAGWINLQLREGDHLARYGGEEFAVLLPQCDAALAFQVAERIRLFVASRHVDFENREIRLTVSIGIATFDADHHEAGESEGIMKTLLKQADMAVYAAKNAGRNRVCVYSPEQVLHKT